MFTHSYSKAEATAVRLFTNMCIIMTLLKPQALLYVRL